MNKLKSIRLKFIVPIAILLLVSFAFIIVFTGWKVEEKTKADVLEQTKGIVKELEHSSQQFLQKYDESIQLLSESQQVKIYGQSINASAEVKSLAERDLQEIFNQYTRLYKDVLNVYFAAPNKQFKMVPATSLSNNYDPTIQSWFKLAVDNKKAAAWSEPYENDSGTYVITVSKALYSGKNLIGVVGVDINLTSLTNHINDLDIGYKGYPVIMAENGDAIVHPKEKGNDLTEQPLFKKALSSEKDNGIAFDQEVEQLFIYQRVNDTNWTVGAVFNEAELISVSQEIRNILLITALSILIIMIVVIYYLSAKISKPIEQLNQSVSEVAKGNLHTKVTIKGRDEVAQLGHSFNHMIDNMKNIIAVVSQSAQNVRESITELNTMAQVSATSSERTVVEINEIAVESASSADKAQSAKEQSEGLSEIINAVSAKTEKMSTFALDADQANQQGVHHIHSLQQSNETSKQFIDSTEEVITELGTEIQQIEKIIHTITDISAQTNLLALNASIEAARAGTYGKGFSVVAHEVRKLAEQSNQAAQEIQEMIETILQGSHKAVNQIVQTKENFTEQTKAVKQANQIFENNSTLMNNMKELIDSLHLDMQQVAVRKDELLDLSSYMAALSQQTAVACEKVNNHTDEQLSAVQSVTVATEQLKGLNQELQQSVQRFHFQNEVDRLVD